MELAFFFVLLATFKVELLGGEAEASGLRVDDFLIAGFAFLVTWPLLQRRLFLWNDWRHFSIVVAFVGWGVASSAVSAASPGSYSGVQGFLFSIRHLEYWVLVLLGGILARSQTDRRIVQVFLLYLIYLLVITLLQAVGLVDAVSNYASADRLSGNLGGPWELAQIAVFFLLLPVSGLMECLRYGRILRVGVLLAGASLLFASGSRMGLISGIISFTFSLMSFSSYNTTKRNYAILGAVALASSLVILTAFETVSVTASPIQRLQNLASYQTVQDLLEAAQTPAAHSREHFEFLNQRLIKDEIGNVSSDASAYARMSRWALAVRSTFAGGPINVLFGNGPSYFGHSLDGAYLRLFVETGVVGLLLYTWLLRVLWRTAAGAGNWTILFRSYLLSLIVSAAFIDVFYTYKAMLLMWVIYGILLFRKSEVKRWSVPQCIFFCGQMHSPNEEATPVR